MVLVQHLDERIWHGPWLVLLQHHPLSGVGVSNLCVCGALSVQGLGCFFCFVLNLSCLVLHKYQLVLYFWRCTSTRISAGCCASTLFSFLPPVLQKYPPGPHFSSVLGFRFHRRNGSENGSDKAWKNIVEKQLFGTFLMLAPSF